MSIDSIGSPDYWKDLERAKNATISFAGQPISSLPPVGAVQQLKPTSLGLSSPVGSIQESSAKPTAPLFRPTLQPPEENTLETPKNLTDQLKNFLLILVQLQITNDELTALSVEVFEAEIEIDSARLQQLNEELKIAITKYFQSAKNEAHYELFQAGLRYFVSAMSIVFGSSLLATGAGTLPGALLISAGGLGLISQFMYDTGFSKTLVSYATENRAMQEEILCDIKIVGDLLALTGNLTGSAVLFQANILTEILTIDRMMKGFTLGTAVANAGTELGKSVSKNQSYQIQAKITLLTAEKTYLDHGIIKNSMNMQAEQKFLEQNVSMVKKVVELLNIGPS